MKETVTQWIPWQNKRRLFRSPPIPSRRLGIIFWLLILHLPVGNRIFDLFGDDLKKKVVLIIGAGKIGETTLRHLAKSGAEWIFVANRSFERAQELAEKFNGQAVPYEELGSVLIKADVVIASSSAPRYVLGEINVAPALQKKTGPMFLIDLGMPRNIDPALQFLEGMYLYNIDQLSELAKANLERRQNEAAVCEKLVGELVSGWVQRLFPNAKSSKTEEELKVTAGFPPWLIPVPVHS